MVPKLNDRIESACLEDVNNVAASQDDHRMTIFANLSVGLAIEVRRCNHHTELAMP